jgi:hypothetical protein
MTRRTNNAIENIFFMLPPELVDKFESYLAG